MNESMIGGAQGSLAPEPQPVRDTATPTEKSPAEETPIAVTAEPSFTPQPFEDEPNLPVEIILESVAPDALTGAAEPDENGDFEADGVRATISDDASEAVGLSSDVGSVSVELPFSEQATALDTVRPGISAFDNGNGSKSVALINDDASVQVNTVIESVDAPNSYPYPLTLPEGSSLLPQPNGQVLIQDSEGGDLGIIDAPWALDANGAEVPTRYTVDGTTLTQVVDHTNDNVYPVVADPQIVITKYEYKYVNKKSYLNWTNKSRQLGICKVEKGAANGSCKITVTQAVKSEVSTAFGLSTKVVSANVGVNLAYSKTVSVSWASARAKVGSTFKAWAVGKRTTFNIQKWRVTHAGNATKRYHESTSGTLAGFTPVVGFAVGQ